MTGPQIEEGYLRIANELAEAFARTNLSGYEWRVLWAIVRATYGWQKKTDVLSYDQLSKRTNLDRRHVGRTLTRLVERKIITRQREDARSSWEYGLQKDYTKWDSAELGTSAYIGPNRPPKSD